MARCKQLGRCGCCAQAERDGGCRQDKAEACRQPQLPPKPRPRGDAGGCARLVIGRPLWRLRTSLRMLPCILSQHAERRAARREIDCHGCVAAPVRARRQRRREQTDSSTTADFLTFLTFTRAPAAPENICRTTAPSHWRRPHHTLTLTTAPSRKYGATLQTLHASG
jgi:hypothetical protein